MTMLSWHIYRLHGHDSAMDESGPDGEPNQTAMLQRVARGDEKKHAESGIHSKNHLLIFGLIRLPTPSRRPQRHHQRVNAEQKNQSEDNKRNAEQAHTCCWIHVDLLICSRLSDLRGILFVTF